MSMLQIQRGHYVHIVKFIGGNMSRYKIHGGIMSTYTKLSRGLCRGGGGGGGGVIILHSPKHLFY